MATNIYDTCTNPISGEAFKTISFGPDAYVMQWTVQPKGYVPFEHIHLNQDEVFNIKSGEIKIVMNGKEHFANEGETLTVPKGVAHIAYNNKDAVLDCLVEYKPGLDHDIFMQCFTGLTNDGFIDKKGGISIPKMGYFLIRMKAKCMTRPTEIPAPIFSIALKVFYLRGLLSGWSKLYKKYTGK
jgi:mannose-6-phosphate isomerase-like protein (cupin superfamily)